MKCGGNSGTPPQRGGTLLREVRRVLSEHQEPAIFLLSLATVWQPLALKGMAASQRLTVSGSFSLARVSSAPTSTVHSCP